MRALLLALLALALLAVVPGSAVAAYGSGQFCSTYKEAEYNRAGYTCKPGSDGRNRLHTWSGSRGGSRGGGSTKPTPAATCTRPGSLVRVQLSRTKHRAVWRHVRIAVRKGWPRVMRINRRGADRRRARLLRGIPTRAGFDRDEYPMAMARKGWRASVMYIPRRQNRSAGAIVGNALRGLCDGVRFALVFR